MAERTLTVLQVLPALDSGGVERGTLEVARELVRQGHHSMVISAGGRMTDELINGGSEHIAWTIGRKSLSTLRYGPHLRKLLKARRIDIVHARSRLPAWITWFAWHGMDPATRPRFVTTVHGLYTPGRYSSVMTFGERVIAVSETVREYVLKNYPKVDPSIIRVIHRGVDAAAFPHGYRPPEDWLSAWRAQYPQLEGRHVITLPARLTRWKGHEHFIRIIAGLKRRGLPVHGLIVGDAHPRKEHYPDQLRAQVAAQGLQNDITFAGHRNDLREIMAVSHIVLSLSLDPEAFGRVSLEALSLGVPVAGYDHGGVGEQLAAIFPAGRVPVGDEQAMEALLAEWCELAPAVPAGQPFTLARMLSATMDVYRELAEPD